ncbi:GGDEF domain-containing protein [Actinoplanes sp. NEAU-A12]|uniref:GGDEF domain-containing protein n=1 Tax=Actinoplanes sandaracinus TaxID=3045177 RepID=A0ABT6WJW5_9ACTN|nr:GGDEF domain-containing protein [Actinoplanes sandaracinus]MDI6100018.1 GGDEF domain-containing protein [Actinoplanes sandaracinus]
MPHQLRDLHGAARAVAYLMLAAGPYNLITGVLMKLGEPAFEVIAIGVISCALFVLGLICLRRPEALPRLFWTLLPLVSAGVITGLNIATADASMGAQLFYLWPLLYAASFVSRRIVALTVAQISAGQGLVAYQLQTGDQALNDWIALTVAMTMTALVVTGLRERNDKLRDVLQTQATSDSLTGSANRRAFDAELGRAVARAGLHDPLALVMIDVDHFKTINDTWGHAAGDRALRAVADALREATEGREHLVARLGGDEFAVLLRAGPYAALQFAELARTRIGAAGHLPGGPPSLSIGIAVAPDHATSAEELQRVADAALYQAKEGGRGRSMMARPATARRNVDQVPEITCGAAPSDARPSPR